MCDMPAVMDIAKRYELEVIEDACEALGAEIRTGAGHEGMRSGVGQADPDRLGRADQAAGQGIWRKAGTFGRCAAFGFYPNKQMTTGEGGVVVTDDDEIAGLCRSMRNQGRGETAAWLQHERLGYNYRLSDINCALGIGQLSRIEEMLAKREQVAGWYAERLRGVADVVVPEAREGERISWFVYVVRLADRFTRQDRDRIIAGMRERGIVCGNYFTPIHLQPFYREMFGYKEGDFPVTEAVADRTIALPFYNELSEGQLDEVCKTLKIVA